MSYNPGLLVSVQAPVAATSVTGASQVMLADNTYATVTAVLAVGGSTAPAVPGQVTGVTAGTITASSIGISYTAPTSGGAQTGYAVTYTPAGGAAVTTAVTGTSATLSGLVASKAYSITVAATNASGTGLASSAITATTLAAPAGAGTLTLTTPAGGAPGASMTLAGTFTGAAPQGIGYAFDGGSTFASANGFAISGSTWTATGVYPAAGNHTVTVQETNATSVTATSGAFTVVAAAQGIAYVVRNDPNYGFPATLNLSGAGYASFNGNVTVRGPANQTPASLRFAIGSSGTVPPVLGQGDYGVANNDNQPGVLNSNQASYPQSWGSYPSMYIINHGQTAGTVQTKYIWILPQDSSGSSVPVTNADGTPQAFPVTY